LEATRETVAFRPDTFELDYRQVHKLHADDLRNVDVLELESAARHFRGRFLDDLYLPRCPDFEAWRVALANEVELAELRIRRTLIDRLVEEHPELALVHARALLALNTDDEALIIEVEALQEQSRQRAIAPSRSTALRPPMVEYSGSERQPRPPSRAPQDIRYCKTKDGAQIAYAVTGQGYPILKCANWMSHLQYEWESPVWRHWMSGLSLYNRLVRYDQRGNGLSDWNVKDISIDDMVADLECVADAANLDRFALLGVSRGCPISVIYAARHPERVSHLILYGGRARGWQSEGEPAEVVRRSAMLTLIRVGWGQDNPAFRQMFTSHFIPDATSEQMAWFNELQRRTISPENAIKYQQATAAYDVTPLLSQVDAPTLVLNATGDMIVPFEAGRAYATGIRGARFVPLESKNHILLAHELAFALFLGELKRFLETE